MAFVPSAVDTDTDNGLDLKSDGRIRLRSYKMFQL